MSQPEPKMLDDLSKICNERAPAKEPDPHHRLPELESKERRRPGRPKGAKYIT